ncbi:MAG: hypothetical protein IPG50_17105 [Myxococcales bacterium]|nr:hypothetical protein [Myxococcales bacterium]
MSLKALKINVDVGADHTVRLPDEVPVGPAELIVLLADAGDGAKECPPSPIGLFKDEPELVDEIMDHVRDIRGESRLRPMP